MLVLFEQVRGLKTFVNSTAVTHIMENNNDDKQTVICFAGGEEDYVTVKENIAEVYNKLNGYNLVSLDGGKQ